MAEALDQKVSETIEGPASDREAVREIVTLTACEAGTISAYVQAIRKPEGCLPPSPPWWMDSDRVGWSH